MSDFVSFPKLGRFSREVIITEKLDGTNAQVFIQEDGTMLVGSRNRWITVKDDNYGFARWCEINKDELVKLGPGRHFGEWWGSGIQRGYGLVNGEKRFSLFNVGRWNEVTPSPACCHVVPTLWRGVESNGLIPVYPCIAELKELGSKAAPGFMKPEGIIIFHVAGNVGFKKTLENDDQPKSVQKIAD